MDHEIGGDYEFALAGGRLKLIGLARYDHEPFAQRRADQLRRRRRRHRQPLPQTRPSSERIARAEYRWKWGKSDWQMSGRGRLQQPRQRSPHVPRSTRTAIHRDAAPGRHGTVKEDRYEVMVSYGRPLSSKLTVQLGAGGEYSRLEPGSAPAASRAPSGGRRARSPRPGRRRPKPRRQFQAPAPRRPAQLRRLPRLGRPHRRPRECRQSRPGAAQSWEAELEATRDLGRYGTTTSGFTVGAIDDIVDTIPIGLDRRIAAAISTGPALMAPSGRRPSTSIRSGWKGAKLDLRAQAQKPGQGPADRRAPPDLRQSSDHLVDLSPAPRHTGQRLGLGRQRQLFALRQGLPAHRGRPAVGGPGLGERLSSSTRT